MKSTLIVFLLLSSLLWCGCVSREDVVIGEESEGGDSVESEGGEAVESKGGDSVESEGGEAVESKGGDSVESEGGDGVESKDSLLLLDDDTFNDAVKEVDFMVVEFYNPWCHHCDSLLSVLADISSILGPQGIQFSRVNIEKSVQLKTRFQISQVPDIRLMRRGVASPYTGPNQSLGKQALIDYFLEEAAKSLEEGPLTLTEDNFDNIVNSSPLILVEFYAEWCVHCQQLEPHFYGAAKRLLHNNPPILLGQVKVPDQIEVAKRFGVSGYPLLIVFRYGRQYNYTGPREEEGIVRYMKHQAGPSSQFLSTIDEARAFSRSNNVTRAIGFLSESTSSKVLERYMESGNEIRMDMELGHCTDSNIAKEMGYKTDTIVVFHPRDLVSQFENGYSIIKSIPSKQSELTKLLLKNSRPLVGCMTEDNQLSVFSERPLLVAYFDLSWDLNPKTIHYWHNLIASVAKDFIKNKKQLTFAIADEQEFPTDIKVLGLEDWGEDVAVGIFAEKGVRYSMKEELTSETLREFVEGFLDDEFRPHLNSEPTPKPMKNSAIKKVVGNTFEKFMTDQSKNRLLKLCLPEAPDCEKAKEYFAKVVARYEGMKEIVFGEMNMALNDLPPSVNMDGSLPVFLFAHQGSKDIVQVSPKPQDDADLLFFLKVRHSIRPTLTERDIALRAKYKRGGKKDKKKGGKDKKDKKKPKKDEL